MDCPNCQQPVDDGARFCASCGRAVATDPNSTSVLQQAVPSGSEPVTTVLPANAGELRGCPACGADNSAQRMICARCGADLDSGERLASAPVVAHPGPAEDVAGDVRPPRRSANRAALVVAVVIAVGAAVGVLIGLLLVDAGRDPEAAPAVFDPGVYPEEPVALDVTGVGASSERPPAGEVTYGAGNLVDKQITTAWSHDPAVEAAVDVDLAFALSDPAWVTSLTFANGAQADDLAFTADGRILRLRLLVDGDAAAELQLLDQQGLQRVELPEPVLVDTIRLVVLEAVPGDTYDEVSLSEVVITGHPARGDDLARMLTDEADGADGADEQDSDEADATAEE